MCLNGRKYFSIGAYYCPSNENSDGLDELADTILSASKEYGLRGRVEGRWYFNVPDLVLEYGKSSRSGNTLHTTLNAIVETF